METISSSARPRLQFFAWKQITLDYDYTIEVGNEEEGNARLENL